MKIIKKQKNIINFMLFIIILTTILTIFNIIFPIQNNINKIISFSGVLLYTFILGLKTGKETESKGYKIGFKLGISNIIILYILSCITLTFKLPLSKIIYYITILITTILGSIIGINKKTLNN